VASLQHTGFVAGQQNGSAKPVSPQHTGVDAGQQPAPVAAEQQDSDARQQSDVPAHPFGKSLGQQAAFVVAQTGDDGRQHPPLGRMLLIGQQELPLGQQPPCPVPSGQQLSRESQQDDSDPAGQTFWFGAQRHVPLLEQI
jgi:hypothetical protein